MTRYDHVENEMKIINDVEDNDFSKLVKEILDSIESIHIDGRAGTGKSTLIKMLQAEMEKREISFISLAPTNKACRIINGQTIHRFVASNQILKDKRITHIFIDEVSMMCEAFYKYFIVLKRMRPELIYIIAGDLNNYYQ